MFQVGFKSADWELESVQRNEGEKNDKTSTLTIAICLYPQPTQASSLSHVSPFASEPPKSSRRGASRYSALVAT